MLTENSTLVVVKDQVSCDLAGEAAILNLKNGAYYGLNPVGARVWKLVQEPTTFAQVREAIVAEFEVTPDRCQADLRVLLDELANLD